MSQYYTGARIFDDGRLLQGFALHVENGRTQALLPESAIPEGAPRKALPGGILTPGFVETQANGGAGILVNERFDADALAQVLAGHRQFGTVAMLPTFITDSQDKYHAAIASIAQAVRDGVPGIVGGHFEGPFLNPAKKGTHQPRFLRVPDERDFAVYAQHGEYLQHSILSLAPEQLAPGTIARIKPHIPQINMAHSMATHEDLERAVGEGLTGITHLFNAMAAMEGRNPGAIGSAAALGLQAGIIADGVHAHPYSLLAAYRMLGKTQLMLVTDSMHTIGVDGISEFDLMGIKVFVDGNRLVNEYGSLAGAHINMLQCVQNAVRFMQADIASALTMAIATPARYIGLPQLARIAERRVQDILWLDEALALREWA
ncbi:MAG: N-acetylglucosamine-6-phosphate deacetylase [Cardiobacteriaceae bacterium]|nr:N-acetylglucosamine-6-phosphate deacetylase [Cardiobacteriaceae bacterium]